LKQSKNKLAQAILQACLDHNVKQVVISPGSRNAPLTIAFGEHPAIEALSIVDERSAGFVALGMAQQSQKTVALVCTSGSALLNYYPAVAEAFYSHIPLVIISADRPKKWIDQGDGQTIRQENVFDNHSLFNANLKENLSNVSLISEALTIADAKKGPVHINVPFDEPLYEMEPLCISAKAKATINQDSLLNEIPLEVSELEPFAKKWNKAKRKLVLIGVNYPNELLQIQLNHLAKDPSVLVMTETTSNVHNELFISNIDQLITPFDEQQFLALQPEVLLTLGGMVVSKRIKQFLRNYKPQEHWHISPFYNAPNTYECLTKHFQLSSDLFFSQFFFLTEKKASNYQKKFIKLKVLRAEKHTNLLAKVPFSDLKAYELVLKSLPKTRMLQVANSSAIRYTQLFSLDKSLTVFCNRGTSGIDGASSTAVGAAINSDKQTVLLTGDISFFYDSNAFWNNYIKKDFRVILINNSGGGIFRYIPGPSTTNELETYFETKQNRNAANFAKMYDFDYHLASDLSELKTIFVDFYKASDKPKILEIQTPRTVNDTVLKNYFKNL
jgi:2-succinyl-5-enolpyruvyl-6-hydroxy-3-cyclohexene-1-carboxylate synthase